MGKHKKKLREEKSKVKLKKNEKTKFLPKGQNVTDTSFKIKAIVLPEQLRAKDQGDLLSKRSLDIKDLIQRIKHYNENVRHSACEEMADMIKFHHQEFVTNHLAVVIRNVTALIQDKIAKVRASAVKVIDKVLEYASLDQIEPFFDILSVNLRCAMTNINKIIQEDSLLLLDALLKHVPTLIAKSSEKILSDFFTLISKLRSDSHIGRTLTVNLGSQMTSVRWRLKVLSRLYKILKAVIEENQVVRQKTTVVCNVYEGSCCPLYKDSLSQKLECCEVGFFDDCNVDSETSKTSTLNKHIVTLIPLLYETWIEVVPDSGFKTDTTVLTEESSAMLSCIMKILYLLFEYSKINESKQMSSKDVFLSKQGRKFLAHLASNFPYSQGERIKEKHKSKSIVSLLEGNHDPKCVEENLLICYIYSVFYIHQGNKDLKIRNIVAYITRCLLVLNNSINAHNIKFLILILRSILIEHTKMWQVNDVSTESILENAITFYDNSRMPESQKLELFNMLVEVSDNELLKRLPKYDAWISNTVNCLVDKQIPSKKLQLLLSIAKRNNGVFKKSFSKQLPAILDNLKLLRILGEPEENDAKKEIIKMIYYLPLNHQNISDVNKFITSNSDYLLTDFLRLIMDLKGLA